MKKFYLFIFIGVLLIAGACDEAVTGENLEFPSLAPGNPDAAAGNWMPILLSSKTEFSVPAPAAITSSEYIAQINEVKSWQKELTGAEKDLLKYWGAGAVLRWNEIMRELVAKHNRAPVENPDGTYSIPSSSNPLAYPTFPFANPPYAARAYAYVSAAQYDALISAYHYKQVYQRQGPSKVDTSVKELIPVSTLPSYPSEDAAVAGVSVALLNLLFPGDQDFIQMKAEEHRRARLLGGGNVRSDLDAGEALGKAVAAKFIARARTDKAGAAVGISNGVNKWAEFEQSAQARGEIAWVSQDAPKRPPMLPYFGRVKAFLFDSATMVNQVRPEPPPSTSSEQFRKETEEVLYYSRNPTRERFRIVHYWADGVGTYTPPGHWNAIAAEEIVKLNWSEVRWARAMAYLNMTMMDAAIACWDAKFYYYNPRPSQVDNRIKTLTGLPNFPSYISGHSTFSGAAATILGHLIPAKAADFEEMAQEASLSRLYGAIHYRSDCEKGLETGNKIGAFAVQKSLGDGAGEP
jgi:hypothetical protein